LYGEGWPLAAMKWCAFKKASHAFAAASYPSTHPQTITTQVQQQIKR
jgi:hypothetical protein